MSNYGVIFFQDKHNILMRFGDTKWKKKQNH